MQDCNTIIEVPSKKKKNKPGILPFSVNNVSQCYFVAKSEKVFSGRRH